MSSVKRYMEEQQAALGEGLALCIEVGALRECKVHEGTYFQGHQEVIEAYKLAARRVGVGKISGTQRDVTDAVRAAYEDNSGADSCGQCDKLYERD